MLLSGAAPRSVVVVPTAAQGQEGRPEVLEGCRGPPPGLPPPESQCPLPPPSTPPPHPFPRPLTSQGSECSESGPGLVLLRPWLRLSYPTLPTLPTRCPGAPDGQARPATLLHPSLSLGTAPSSSVSPCGAAAHTWSQWTRGTPLWGPRPRPTATAAAGGAAPPRQPAAQPFFLR